ncbi:P-loop containing nucleoside triphosphate hydrolase protein [Lasiosphaeris hirsuta]|uniref:RNA helicase n=1 Tax=Lasiosphaeris hirsuta TaxID=260670 RepID=A0AA40A2Q7_9PEZI|nr:P-loop containing nucleoside triphosphate hydrolase protein [Lasiosphaeris hirsuta]
MSGKKHSRSEGDEQADRSPKKAKTVANGDAPTNGDASDVIVKKAKKQDKYDKQKKLGEGKREKSGKKGKTQKKEKKKAEVVKDPEELEDAPEVEVEVVAKAEAVVEPEAEVEAVPEPKKEKKEKKDKKDKKDKKEKNEKKEKKEKKSKKSKDSEDAAEENGASNGVATETVTPEAAPATNGLAQRNGAAYTYKQTAALAALSEADMQVFLTKKEIHITDPLTTKLRPIVSFSHLPTSQLLSKKPFGAYTDPTPIQSASWPFALSGRDVVGIAETGSGKTMAFAVPCIEALSSSPKPKYGKQDRSAHARAVVVSPTRELAMQTHAAISTLASLVGLSAVCLYGGASKDEQRTLLRRSTGADIIIATPGRLRDFISEGSVDLGDVMFAVLDEADRMLDKGFEEDIKQILGSCPPRERRQTLMFTATWPMSVRGLADGYMVDPVMTVIGNRTRAGGDGDGNGEGSTELQANSRIHQTVEVVDPRGKEQRLLELLREAQKGSAKDDRILVFCLYKKEATRVEQFLERNRIHVAAIHGDLRQEQRTRSLEAFKSGTTSVLVATDVAARGLDIPEVKLVINLTFPLTIEDYVHRIGRTGRAGKVGKAITLFTEHDKAHSGSLVNILKAAKQDVPEELLKFGTTVKKKAHDSYGTFFKEVDMSKKGTKITFD